MGRGGTFSYRVFLFRGGSTSIKALRQALMWQREGREGAHYLKQSHKEQKA